MDLCSWKQLDVGVSGSKYCIDSEGRMRAKVMCWLFYQFSKHLPKSCPPLAAADRFIQICVLTEDSQLQPRLGKTASKLLHPQFTHYYLYYIRLQIRAHLGAQVKVFICLYSIINKGLLKIRQ